MNFGYFRTFLRCIRTTNSQHVQYRRLATIIDGKQISGEIKSELKEEISQLLRDGKRAPHLSVVLVGDDAASGVYVKNKLRACQHVGITSSTVLKNSSTSQQELLDIIDSLNCDQSVDGVLVQLPVPAHINERAVCNAVSPLKDVDGFHLSNVGRFVQDMDALLPCTPLGVIDLIRRTGIETLGCNAVVCGRSKNVGMPIAMLLHSDGRGETGGLDATTTICHRYTPAEQLRHCLGRADIVVSAVGIANLITGDMIKPGACVIDVGINRIVDKNGVKTLVGDVNFEEVVQVAGYLTPVPGGVGPMTVAMLMRNTLKAYKMAAIAS